MSDENTFLTAYHGFAVTGKFRLHPGSECDGPLVKSDRYAIEKSAAGFRIARLRLFTSSTCRSDRRGHSHGPRAAARCRFDTDHSR
jgi:hypothetical protein